MIGAVPLLFLGLDMSLVAGNLLSPTVLFFFLGIVAVLLKSDLSVPPSIAKFLSLYLLFDIGIKGGEELFHSGLNAQVLTVLTACVLMSLVVPIYSFFILKQKLDVFNAGAIAATYGSVSAVTFATAISFLQAQHIPFNGYMVAGMAFMESPAIIAGLFLIRWHTARSQAFELPLVKQGGFPISFKELSTVAHEAFFNGAVMLLLGSVFIGYLAGSKGEMQLKPFVSDIYHGLLCFYLLDMGLEAGRRLGDLRKSGAFLILFALLMPIFNGLLGMGLAYILALSPGNALLFTILVGSASYIAVPAAIRMCVPEANMSLLLPMALGVTFTFNIALGIPIYYSLIQWLW